MKNITNTTEDIDLNKTTTEEELKKETTADFKEQELDLQNANLSMQIACFINKQKLVIEVVNREDSEKTEFYLWNGRFYESNQSENKLLKYIGKLILGIFKIDPIMANFINQTGFTFYNIQNYLDDVKKNNFREKLTKDTYDELKLLQSNIYDHSSIDSDQYHINTENGIVDLRNLKLIPHNPDFLFSKIMNAKFLDNTNLDELYNTNYCKVIRDAIYDPSKNEEENDVIFKSILNVFGYLLVYGNPKRKLPIVIGPTATGKSLITKIHNEIFNSYAGTSPASAFMKTRRSQNDIRPELVKNVDTRILSVVETDADTVFDSVLLKSFTGQDLQSFRRPYKSTVTFRFNGSILFLTNFIPKFSNIEDTAFLDRLLIINFKNTVLEEKRDINLDKKILKEKDKILTLLMYHASFYYQNGEQLITANELKVDKERLILERSDLAKKFVDEKLFLLPKEQLPFGQQKYSKSFIYNEFYNWCTNDLKIKEIPTLRAFFNRFDEIMEYFGCTPRKSSVIYYTGFKIIDAGYDPHFYSVLISDELEDRNISNSTRAELMNQAMMNLNLAQMFDTKKQISSPENSNDEMPEENDNENFYENIKKMMMMKSIIDQQKIDNDE